MDDKRLLPDTLVLITIAVSVVGYIVSKLVDKFTTVDSSDDKNQRTGKNAFITTWHVVHVGTEYKLKQRVIFGLENKPLQENHKKYSMVNLSSGLLYTKTVTWVKL